MVVRGLNERGSMLAEMQRQDPANNINQPDLPEFRPTPTGPTLTYISYSSTIAVPPAGMSSLPRFFALPARP